MNRFRRRRAPSCMRASDAGSTAPRATGRSSTRKSSVTTSNRLTVTGPSSGRGTTRARAIAREAAERLGNAGRRAFVRSDAPAGVNLISRAVALLPPDDPLRVELVPNVRVVQGLAMDMTWADRVLTEAVEAAATTGDRRLAARALVQRGLLRLFTEAGSHGRRADRRRRALDRGFRGASRRTRACPGLAAQGAGALPRAPRRARARRPPSGRSSTRGAPGIGSRSTRSSSGSSSLSCSAPPRRQRPPNVADASSRRCRTLGPAGGDPGRASSSRWRCWGAKTRRTS